MTYVCTRECRKRGREDVIPVMEKVKKVNKDDGEKDAACPRKRGGIVFYNFFFVLDCFCSDSLTFRRFALSGPF